METPVQIDFQGVDTDDNIRSDILRHVEALESHFGRLTAGRVVLKGPGGRHVSGGLYEVNIRLVLPGGKEVNVERTPKADERYAKLRFAINDAFKRARRQLQDQVQRLRGEVKVHEAQPTATVKRLLEDYGFIETPDGREVYFHKNSVLNDQFERLRVGAHVSYVETDGEKGPQASTVRVVEGHSLR
jgi:cold shock CspA family protein